MKTATEAVWPMVMSALGFEDDAYIVAMHAGEFEEEAENVLQLLTVMRAAARQEDADSCLLYTSPSPRERTSAGAASAAGFGAVGRRPTGVGSS